MDSRSGRLGITEAHLLDPGLDDPPGIVRPGAGLRMELDGLRALAGELQALDRAVVEGDVRLLPGLRRGDGEAVILRGDDHAVRRALEDWMVCASVPERQLVRLAAGREREELVAEADPENRDTPNQVAQRCLCVREGRRVAWTVREEDAVVAGELVRIDVVRVNRDRGPREGEPVQDRALASIVHDRDLGPARIREDVRLAGR